MSEEKAVKKGHSIALSGVIGFVLVALLVGIALGAYIGLFVIAPYMHNNQNSQNSNNPNITGDQGSNGNQNNSQNGNSNQGVVNNNNPSPSNQTSSYGGSGQFDLTISGNGNPASGTITANINCAIQQNGNNILLAISIGPTSVSQSLQQAVNKGDGMTFNFAGTVTGLQCNANAQGTIGSGNQGSTFNLNLSGLFTQSQDTFTITVTSASNSQISISNSQPIDLHPN